MRKLPPGVLAALGLSACVDGCDPTDIPLVGDLFDGDGSHAHPCLNIDIPRDTDAALHPCLAVPIGPCLTPAHDPMVHPCLSEIHDPHVGPCLRMPPPARPGPRVGPCLSPARPRPPPAPDVGPCLKIVIEDSPVPPSDVPVHPCLSVMRPDPAPAPAPPGDQSGRAVTPRDRVLARLVADGVLPQDVLARLTGGTGGPRSG